MRLKLVGLCSVCALIFGCVWANVDVSNKKASVQNLWKKTAKSITQPKLGWIVDQAISRQKAISENNVDNIESSDNLYTDRYQMPIEESVQTTSEREIQETANGKILEEDLERVFGSSSGEDVEFLTNVKKIVSHDGELKDLEDFLKTSNWNINAKDSFGDTALIIAIQNREDELMKCLIENGADVNLPNDSGNTPLNIAVEKNRVDIVDYLLQNGARINFADLVYGDTPLIMSVRGGFENMIAYLINQGADINQANKKGETPLMVAVTRAGENILDMLLSNKEINLETQDKKGYTALMHAVDNNNVTAVEELMRAGANPAAALNLARDKNKQKEYDIQKSNQTQKTKFRGELAEKLAERAAILERLFSKAQAGDQKQVNTKKKLNETAEEKEKREEIIRLLQGGAQI